MKLKVEHTTLFEYDAPIYETLTEVRLQPGENHNIPQQVLSFELKVDPTANFFQYTDFYGNTVHYFNLLQSHKRVEIKATTIVDTTSEHCYPGEENEIMLYEFLNESKYIHFDPQIQKFAAQFQELISDPYRLGETVCRTINDTFVYEPGVTDVHSTTAMVMTLRRGVCQDFAHIMIAACRYLGIPARYVSGYYYGGSNLEQFDMASHAWCEIYCGAEIGWAAFDPTHDTLFVDERYIRIGAGRDYSDVTLVRGTYKGNVKERLKVIVRVSAVA
ncbi:transglutaminase family protein [Candidatus Chlorohelix sp.]|uniref:transglutaminase family protein n=1 Tax=Candidatus Chlorohelix sp. TaxID=3139201 RepID=UPI00304B6669